ncbi:hypothetical protein ACFVT5_41275 [Streptomyces sp. NPDC058001]|uniref:hypothetical protein n=1 Tax=Streptomyces sp. NPDC058001 TaxID=3346300 RepID=UPI0036E7343E
MPRTAVPYTPLLPNSSLADPAGTTIDATLVTNGVVINNADPEHTLIRVTNSSGSTRVVTVKAGNGTPALSAGQGDLAASIPTTATAWFPPLASGRFQQKGTQLFVDFAAGTTGSITVFKIPRAV